MSAQLRSVRRFEHGIHPQYHKELTANCAVERLPFGTTYTLPLGQHLGAPSAPVVIVGQRVQRGDVVAQPKGFVSTALHSPVTGTVTSLGSRQHPNGQLVQAITIEADPYSTQRFMPKPPLDWRSMDIKTFIGHVQKAGLVGMGGAAFPSHVKFSLPEGKQCKVFVVNGAECEPYLTTDHRTMVETPERVLRGIEIATHHLKPEKVVIGVELNKPEAIDQLRGKLPSGVPVEVIPLDVKYPQGAEKILIKAMFGVEVPSGKLPIDVGFVVNNVGTLAALCDYFDTGKPLIERIVTVSGPGAERPTNVMVPLGTPVREVLAFCGGLKHETRLVILGGPMMGIPLASLDVPVLKGSSGILAFTDAEVAFPREYACVKCGRCSEACPYFLNPSRLARLSRSGRYEEAESLNALDCMECGSCSFSCPSGIPIVQLIRVAKNEIRKRKVKSA